MMTALDIDAILSPDWCAAPYQAPSRIKAVFLTGATGFIGLFLLREWLRQSDAILYCLVRNADSQQVQRDFQQQLTQLQAWQDDYAARIVPVTGDLSQPNFALSDAQFAHLAANCDVILHNGAHVNFMRPYDTLKPTNVDGTREVIRFALLNHSKPIHFISSIAVFFSDRYTAATTVQEETPLDYDPSIKGGYKQTKWVAERLLLQARAQGLPVNIYRLARVFGDSQTGVSTNSNDLLYRVLKASFLLQHYPQLETAINLVPADYVAQAIYTLMQQPSALNQTFHVCNPDDTDWNSFFAAANTPQTPMQGMPYPDWLALLSQASRKPNASKFYAALQLSLRFPNYLLTPKPYFDTRNLTAQLAETSLRCPSIDAALIARYLAYFQQTGVINDE